MAPESATNAHRAGASPLAEAVVALAETPDDSVGIDAALTGIARLAVDRVAAADYTSVTTLYDGAYTTVATSSAVARAVDEAASAGGPAAHTDVPRAREPLRAPEGATMLWPGFHRAAPGLGLPATLSVPLYTGRGLAVAVLNLYGRDRAAMAPLIAAMNCLLASPQDAGRLPEDYLGDDPGAEELLTGYAEALTVRATIQLAVDVLARRASIAVDDAYGTLCARAAADHTLLSRAAATLIARQR
jgi:hypothetical protein